jgi:hypothetical protein
VSLAHADRFKAREQVCDPSRASLGLRGLHLLDRLAQQRLSVNNWCAPQGISSQNAAQDLGAANLTEASRAFKEDVWKNYPREELNVKDFMIRHAKLLGISEEDVVVLRAMGKTQMKSRVDLKGKPLVEPASFEDPK